MKKVKRLKIMAAGLALSMVGCTIVKDSNFCHISQYEDHSILSFDEVDPNSIFFHKTIRDQVTLQDIILTSEERNIEENSSIYYQQIIGSIEEDSFPIQQLHIEENLAQAFLATGITHKNLNHKNTTLYNEQENNIYWDKVADIWMKNSIERVQLDKQYLEFSHSQSLYLELSCLEEDKIHLLVKQMQEFIEEIQEQLPTIDMQRIACQLEEMSFCYSNHSYDALLVTDQFTLIFPNSFGCYLDIEYMKKDLFHEFKHLIATPCDDEVKNHMYYPSQTGIYTIIEKSDIPKQENRNSYTWYYLPFDWLFLEEAGAETFSSEILQQLPVTYQMERQIEQDLLLSISWMPNFDKDIFVKTSLLHNPIALLQQFPIPDNNQEIWLYQNAKMIECYNILNSPQALLNYILNIEEVKGYEHIFKRQNNAFSKEAQAILLNLEDSADLQMLRIFFANLMNINKDLTLEDYIYFCQLMDMRIQNHRQSMFLYYGITIEDSNYQEKKQELYQYFEKYLQDEFGVSNISLENTIEISKLSQSFSEEEQLYYEKLFQEAQYRSLHPVCKDKQALDKILSYYLEE